jgi:hypothetical protein
VFAPRQQLVASELECKLSGKEGVLLAFLRELGWQGENVLRNFADFEKTRQGREQTAVLG